MKRLLIIISMTFVLVTSITANAQNRLFLGDWYGTWNCTLYNETIERSAPGKGKTIVRIELNGDSFAIRVKEVYSLPGEPEETLYWPNLDIVSFDDQQITAQYKDIQRTYYSEDVHNMVKAHNTFTYHFVLFGSVLVLTKDSYTEERDHSQKGWPIYKNNVYRRENVDPVETGGLYRQQSELRLYKNVDW